MQNLASKNAQFGILGKLQIFQTLASGSSCKVKLGLDTETDRYVAVKIMKDSADEEILALLNDEIEALNKLNHPNIIQKIDSGAETYQKSNGQGKEVVFIVLELAGFGTLHDFLSAGGDAPLGVEMARFYFSQLLSALQHCYEQNVCHRDLKAKNLMIDDSGNLKIGDFGFAAPANGKDGKGFLTTKLGTSHCLAPEIWNNEPYSSQAIDVFSCGVILFNMVAGIPPFTTAQPQDQYYKCIQNHKHDIFWKAHGKKMGGTFSEDFKDLINITLAANPGERPSIDELMAHPWMNGELSSEDQIKAEIDKRRENAKKIQEQDHMERKLEKINSKS